MHGRIGPDPDPTEDGLQWVGGPKVHPVLFGIPIERDERIPAPKHGVRCVLMVMRPQLSNVPVSWFLTFS